MATLYFLHGFLGKPNDWNFLKDTFSKHSCVFINLFNGFNQRKSLQSFASALNEQVEGYNNFLIGYSLGGRLGLHTLLINPERWQAAVLVSTHPGLSSEIERCKRLKHDQLWARRFLFDDWEILMNDWNQQSVLHTSVEILRSEREFNRKYLSNSLQEWSLGHQLDLRKSISRFPKPLCWIVGDRDERYCHLSSELQFRHADSKVLKIENAGHRVPWDQQLDFVSKIQSFLNDTDHDSKS